MSDHWISAPCREPCARATAAAEARQRVLTKPPGSLGELESIAVRLAGLQRTDRPRADRVPFVLFAGDHGVTAQGVSPYPSAVTVQMMHNFAYGGAAISVLARTLNCPLSVVDAGTLADTPIEGVVTDKPRQGTRDFSVEAAMTAEEAAFALSAGRRAVARACDGGADLIVLGDMGIGNTTSAAAVAAALLGLPGSDLVGAGTGLDQMGINNKAAVIDRALALHGFAGRPENAPEQVVTRVGGLEIAALAGAIIAAAQAQVPILLDGFIVSVAALLARRMNPSTSPWLLFGHRSAERGHGIVLEALDAKPMLDLGLRLGEGSGAATALPLVRLACALHNGMATFEEAAVSDRPA